MTHIDHQTDSEYLYRTKQHSTNSPISPGNPTTELTEALTQAYEFFNDQLFHAILPSCVITVQRRSKRTYGYFLPESWEDHGKAQITHELALNPDHFHTRSTMEVLSTLVHEQCHLQQHVYGKTGRDGYHNKQFAQMMKDVGLICSDTGKPGGKNTGQRMSHVIEEGGRFEQVCQELLDAGFVIPWHTVTTQAGDDEDDGDDLAKKKRESKTKYSCPDCELNAWAKPHVSILCGVCHQELIVAQP